MYRGSADQVRNGNNPRHAVDKCGRNNAVAARVICVAQIAAGPFKTAQLEARRIVQGAHIGDLPGFGNLAALKVADDRLVHAKGSAASRDAGEVAADRRMSLVAHGARPAQRP